MGKQTEMRKGLSLRHDTYIMKGIVAFIIVMFLLSYQTLEDTVSFIGLKSTALATEFEAREIEAERNAEQWDLSQLDTARSVDYLTAREKNVVLELNKVRSNPKKYANLYLAPTLKHYQGNKLIYPGRITRITKEGRTAVEECIEVLSSAPPVKPLLPSQSLSLAAKDHVLDTGPKGMVGHTGSDGSSPVVRIERHDKTLRSVAETISYGGSEARRIVESLVVDDGVRDRGHRRIIFEAEYDIVGLSMGSHSNYRNVCVIDYANSP
jgi:uncharacterized protein YkwD